MKKKIVAGLMTLALLVSGLSAFAVEISPMWAYLSTISRTLYVEGDGLEWGADAFCYHVSSVTKVKVTVKLQRQSGGIWLTVDSATDTEDGTYAGAGGTYYDWASGESYRLATDVYIYDGSTLLEHVGTLYDFLNT